MDIHAKFDLLYFSMFSVWVVFLVSIFKYWPTGIIVTSILFFLHVLALPCVYAHDVCSRLLSSKRIESDLHTAVHSIRNRQSTYPEVEISTIVI